MKSQLREMWDDKLGFKVPFFICAGSALAVIVPGFFIGFAEWQIIIDNMLGL